MSYSVCLYNHDYASSVYFKNFLRLVDLLLHTTHVTVQPTSVATSTASSTPETDPSGIMMFEH